MIEELVKSLRFVAENRAITTACIKPEYGGDEDYGRGTYA